MTDTTCTIPVRATMSRQPDGTYAMTNAVYADIPADYIARMLIEAFGGVPVLNGGEAGT